MIAALAAWTSGVDRRPPSLLQSSSAPCSASGARRRRRPALPLAARSPARGPASAGSSGSRPPSPAPPPSSRPSRPSAAPALAQAPSQGALKNDGQSAQGEGGGGRDHGEGLLELRLRTPARPSLMRRRVLQARPRWKTWARAAANSAKSATRTGCSPNSLTSPHWRPVSRSSASACPAAARRGPRRTRPAATR